MEEEDHITHSTQLTALFAAVTTAAMAARLLSLQLSLLSFSSHTHVVSHSLILLSTNMPPL
jgi:hypothetical protein